MNGFKICLVAVLIDVNGKRKEEIRSNCYLDLRHEQLGVCQSPVLKVERLVGEQIF